MDQRYKDLLIIQDNISKQREFAALNKAFNSANIPMAPIKGMALLYEFPAYGETRPMADIDILVKKEDIRRSEDILLALGYKIQGGDFSKDYYLNDYHHLPFHGRYMVELHWDLSPPRHNKIIFPELWENTKEIQYMNDTAKLLSLENTIFSLALHLRRFNEPFSLKYIKDMQKILEVNSGRIGWDYILKYSRLNKLESLLYYSLICVKMKLGYPISNKIIGMFYPGTLKAILIKFFITRLKEENTEKIKKYAYVFLRFLLYDTILDFIKFIVLLPEEEFSRFFSIKFPSERSWLIYSLRFLAAPFLFLAINSSKKSSI